MSYTISVTKSLRKACKLILISATATAIGMGASLSASEVDGSLYEGLKARNIGPAVMSGRIAAIDVVESDPNHIFVGAASGGVWHSWDAGLTWESLFDREDVASIGAVAINQNNPSIIWVGTGEGNVRNSVSIGGGIYKSMDGGKTWANMGLKDSEHINRIAIDPTDPDTVYVAAMGHLWSDGGERGIYKTTDGGKTWKKILASDNVQTGATDVIIDPQNPNKLYAALWQFRRYPDYFKSGGPGSGLYVSNNGGANWRQLTEADGVPSGNLGRAVFSISRSNPNTVYALVEAKKSAIIRTDNGGTTWSKVNQEPGIANRPFYYMEIEVDPNDPERLYNIATTLSRSENGGGNFKEIPSVNCCAAPNALHIDLHSLWINPLNSNHMILGNDGGLGITYDKGATWRFVGNLPVAQFYHINVDNDLPYNVYGGLQDNGSFRGPNEVWENGGIRESHWQEIGFGDGFDASAYPKDSMQGYSMSQGGALGSWNLRTGEGHGLRPNPPTIDTELRFNWNSGFAQDPFDSETIYYGSQFFHKSSDRGISWKTLSADMTFNDTEQMRFKASGGLTSDVTAAENYQTIIAIAPSTIKQGVIWVGTDDGRVHVTQDGGETWTSVEGKARGMKGKAVPHIEPSPHDPAQAFIVFEDHRRGDMAPHVFRVDGYGKKFTSLVSKDVKGYALRVQQDHVDPNLLFLGTEFGLFVSTSGGKSWTKWIAGVPTVSVMDMAIQERESDLVLGTHGRAIFVIDDYSSLRNLSDKDFEARLKLIGTTDGIDYNIQQSKGTRFDASTGFRGINAARGAYITFIASGDDLAHPDEAMEKARKAAMKPKEAKSDDAEEKPEDKPGRMTVEISNANGDIIRTFHKVAHQGINRIVWDMREDGYLGLKPVKPGDDKPSGSSVVPGAYSVKLTLGDVTATGSVSVNPDPRVKLTQADYQANYDHGKKIQALTNTANKAVKRIRAAKRDADAIKVMAKTAMKADGADKELLKALVKKAGDTSKALAVNEKTYFIERKSEEGIQYTGDKVMTKINGARRNIGDGAPGGSALAYYAIAEKALADGLAVTNKLFNTDVAELSKMFTDSGLALLKSENDISLP